jgi:hypothetical protein
MDFKFIIILGLVSLLILYIINEFKLLKSHITTSNDNMTKLVKTKFNLLLNDIRELNTDLVNQTKKINKIHSQNITNMSNYYTDSDQDGKNVLQYLSENKASESANFKIDFGNIKNVKTNDNDIISNSSSLDNLEQLKNQDNISVTSDDLSENISEKNNNSIKDNDNDNGRLSEALIENQNDNNSKTSHKSNSSKIITEFRPNDDIGNIKSESKSINSEKSSAKSFTKIEEIKFDNKSENKSENKS